MTDVEEFHFEGANLHRAASLHLVERDFGCGIVANQFALDQAKGQGCCVNGCRNILEQMMNRPNVILMPVGDDDAHHFVNFIH